MYIIMKFNVPLCLVLISILILVLITLCSKREFFNDKVSKQLIPSVKRPYVNIYDNNGNKLNVILISKPFKNEDEFKLYKEHKDNNIFLGICSYLEFPNLPSNPYETFKNNYEKYKYTEICEGWIHGFRNPDNYFPPDIPLHFASESDWIDCNVSKPIKDQEKIYDFIYICLKVDEQKSKCDDWATYNKNWTLAKKCLDVFCNDYKLKGLLVGRKGCELPNGCSYMKTTDMLKHGELQKIYSQAKFLFLPNEKDASPRVLTEALACDIPCLVNKNILGGWKYVNETTGEFFNDETDISDSLDILMNGIDNNKYRPRDYYIENYSVENSGMKLKKFLYKHWGNRINIPEEDVKYVSPEFSKKDFQTCKSSVL